MTKPSSYSWRAVYSQDHLKRGSLKPVWGGVMQLQEQHAALPVEYICRSTFSDFTVLKNLISSLARIRGDRIGYRRPLTTLGRVGFGKCYGGKCTLMSLSDLTG